MPPASSRIERVSISFPTGHLACYFDTTPQFWLNPQSLFDLKQAENESAERIAAEVNPLQRAA